MKKSLIALAVLAAAGAASAQSSVTLFGIVDATFAYGKTSGGNHVTKLTNSGYNSSRIGFRGTEDLGGGMSASVWLEGSWATTTAPPVSVSPQVTRPPCTLPLTALAWCSTAARP